MHETYVMHRKLNKERSIMFYISWYTYVISVTKALSLVIVQRKIYSPDYLKTISKNLIYAKHSQIGT
jgi:hypothetical protein